MKLKFDTFSIFFTEKCYGDMSQKSFANRQRFLKQNSIKTFQNPHQVHGDKILDLDHSPLSKEADAIISAYSNIFTGVLTADCLPILFFDESSGLHGAIHAGRKSTFLGITEKVIEYISEKYNVDLRSLHFVLGPHNKVCCYEIGQDILPELEGSTYFSQDFLEKREEKLYLDIEKANIFQLTKNGIRNEQIIIYDECTFCSENFFSYRRGNKDERFLSMIGRF